MTKKIKPCPFCGKEPYTRITYRSAGGGTLELVFEVVCECGISRGYIFNANNKSFEEYIAQMDKAIALWNKRAEDSL